MTIALSYNLKVSIAAAVDIKEIIINHADLINFKKLSASAKAELLETDDTDIVNAVLKHGFTADEKYHIITSNYKLSKKHRIVLTRDEYLKLSDCNYAELLKNNFSDHFSKEKWDKMTDTYRREVAKEHLKEVIDAGVELPRLTANFFTSIPLGKINLLSDDQIRDNCKSGWVWNRLIDKNSKKYTPLFLSALSKITPATEIREVFYNHPELIKSLTLEMINNTRCLTCKQWLLLMKSVMIHHSEQVEKSRYRKNPMVNVFDGWKPTQEFIDGLELDLNMEMLNGKSKVTKQFQNARQFLKALAQGTVSASEEDDEDTTVV